MTGKVFVERDLLICTLYARGDVTQKALGERFNLTPQMISRIVLKLDSKQRKGANRKPTISPELAAQIRTEAEAGASVKQLMRSHSLSAHYIQRTLGKIRSKRKRRGPLLLSGG